MNNNLTEIIFLLDKSGSMSCMGDEPFEGFNQFIEEQKDPALGDANVTLVLFGTDVNVVYDGIPINEVPKLTNKDYRAEGWTALRDAIGITCDKVGKRLANTPEKEKPGKVMVCIFTDGDDTSSREYSTEQISKIIKEQTSKYSWKFQFLGTTQESILAAQSYNISSKDTFKFDNSTVGLRGAYATSSACLVGARTS